MARRRCRRVDLHTEGRVPGIDAETFRTSAEQAKAGCPVSRALAGIPEIVLRADLLPSGGDSAESGH